MKTDALAKLSMLWCYQYITQEKFRQSHMNVLRTQLKLINPWTQGLPGKTQTL